MENRLLWDGKRRFIACSTLNGGVLNCSRPRTSATGGTSVVGGVSCDVLVSASSNVILAAGGGCTAAQCSSIIDHSNVCMSSSWCRAALAHAAATTSGRAAVDLRVCTDECAPPVVLEISWFIHTACVYVNVRPPRPRPRPPRNLPPPKRTLVSTQYTKTDQLWSFQQHIKINIFFFLLEAITPNNFILAPNNSCNNCDAIDCIIAITNKHQTHTKQKRTDEGAWRNDALTTWLAIGCLTNANRRPRTVAATISSYASSFRHVYVCGATTQFEFDL